MIKIATVLGTVRPGNYTAKALALVQDELGKMKNMELIEIDPAKMKLAFPGEKVTSTDNKWLQEAVESATGVILATPEYHGSFAWTRKLRNAFAASRIISWITFTTAFARSMRLKKWCGGRIE